MTHRYKLDTEGSPITAQIVEESVAALELAQKNINFLKREALHYLPVVGKMILMFTMCLMLPLFIASIALGEEGSRSKIKIEGRSNIIVNARQILLADLAEVSSPDIRDDDTVIALKKIVINTSPDPGKDDTIPASRILEKLEEHGVRLNSVTYVLPRVVKITRASRSVTRAEIEGAIKQYFTNNGRDVVIKSLENGDNLVVSPNTNELDLVAYNTVRPNEIGFTVTTKSPDESVQKFNIKAVIDEWLEVPVARRGMLKGSQVTENDVVMARLNLGALPSDAAREREEVVGLESNSEIPAGEIFRKSKLIIPPIIEQGSRVTLIYKSGLFEATASGVAMEPGIMGEEIRVKNSNSKRIIAGRVLSSGMVGVN